MNDRKKAKRLIDDLPEGELADAVDFLEGLQEWAKFTAEMDKFESDLAADHDFALDGDEESEDEKPRHFSFKMVSRRQVNDKEPKVRRWEWGF
ncbi:MAG TPA: hypothetical protein VIH47_08830 [Solirubrobacterales bacterium]